MITPNILGGGRNLPLSPLSSVFSLFCVGKRERGRVEREDGECKKEDVRRWG